MFIILYMIIKMAHNLSIFYLSSYALPHQDKATPTVVMVFGSLWQVCTGILYFPKIGIERY